MGLNIVKNTLKTELSPGINLVAVSRIEKYCRPGGDPIFYNGSSGIIIDFVLVDPTLETRKIHQEIFWLNGFNRSKLDKLLARIDCDLKSDIKKKDIINRKLWIYLRAIYKVKPDGHVDENSEYTIRLFDSAPCNNEKIRPIHSDDPERLNGHLQGDFVQYIQQSDDFYHVDVEDIQKRTNNPNNEHQSPAF